MTPEKLRSLGLATYGLEWQSPLARAIGVNARTVRKWLSGESPISASAEADIRRALGADDVLDLDRAGERYRVILEAGRVAGQATGRNGGICMASLTHGLSQGAELFPRENARLAELGLENLPASCDTTAVPGTIPVPVNVWPAPSTEPEPTAETVMVVPAMLAVQVLVVGNAPPVEADTTFCNVPPAQVPLVGGVPVGAKEIARPVAKLA